MRTPRRLACRSVDELAAAYAAGALDADEERAVSAHLATCTEPHADSRALVDAGAALPASLEPVPPPPGLRNRVLASVQATPQDHRPAQRSATAPTVSAGQPRRRWWQVTPLPTAVAALSLAAAIGVGTWGIGLRDQLEDRDAALGVIAAADAVYPVSGAAGSALVVQTEDRALFIAGNLADLPAGRLYEFWLIGPDATPVPAGILRDTDGVAVVALEAGLGDATTFAVTVEAERVDAPTSTPVLSGDLGG